MNYNYDYTRDLTQREKTLNQARKEKITLELYDLTGKKIEHWNENVSDYSAKVMKLTSNGDLTRLFCFWKRHNDYVTFSYDEYSKEVWVYLKVIRESDMRIFLITFISLLLISGAFIGAWCLLHM